MMLVSWEEAPLVGVPQIDEEHKHLLTLLNQLHEAVQAGRGVAILEGTLNEVIAYAAYHFRHEEALFGPTAYPDADVHRVEHEIFRGKISDLHGKCRFGATEDLSRELLSFMTEWLLRHVKVMDKGYVPYVRVAEREKVAQ